MGPFRTAPCSTVPLTRWGKFARALSLASRRSQGLPTSIQSSAMTAPMPPSLVEQGVPGAGQLVLRLLGLGSFYGLRRLPDLGCIRQSSPSPQFGVILKVFHGLRQAFHHEGLQPQIGMGSPRELTPMTFEDSLDFSTTAWTAAELTQRSP